MEGLKAGHEKIRMNPGSGIFGRAMLRNGESFAENKSNSPCQDSLSSNLFEQYEIIGRVQNFHDFYYPGKPMRGVGFEPTDSFETGS